MPTDASVVENVRHPVAVHRKSYLNRRGTGSSEPIMSLIRPDPWAGYGARRRIKSAGSESVMSLDTLSITSLLRGTMERPDSVVAGQLPAFGDTVGNSWRRAGGRHAPHAAAAARRARACWSTPTSRVSSVFGCADERGMPIDGFDASDCAAAPRRFVEAPDPVERAACGPPPQADPARIRGARCTPLRLRARAVDNDRVGRDRHGASRNSVR